MGIGLPEDLVAAVDVVLTAAAGEFVRPLTFEALTGRPVLASLWEPGRALAHVRLGQEADLIIVAPATALFFQARVLSIYPLALVPLFLGPSIGILTHIYSLRNLATANSSTVATA